MSKDTANVFFDRYHMTVTLQVKVPYGNLEDLPKAQYKIFPEHRNAILEMPFEQMKGLWKAFGITTGFNDVWFACNTIKGKKLASGKQLFVEPEDPEVVEKAEFLLSEYKKSKRTFDPEHKMDHVRPFAVAINPDLRGIAQDLLLISEFPLGGLEDVKVYDWNRESAEDWNSWLAERREFKARPRDSPREDRPPRDSAPRSVLRRESPRDSPRDKSPEPLKENDLPPRSRPSTRGSSSKNKSWADDAPKDDFDEIEEIPEEKPKPSTKKTGSAKGETGSEKTTSRTSK